MLGIRKVPKTGVIYVMSEANKHGFRYGASDWVNLGQGQPETGDLEGSPDRIKSLECPIESLEYSDVEGHWRLRESVAEFYNKTYRKGLGSQYSPENVCIVPGGRAGLARIAATISDINLGHFIPDYTAYEELLDVFKNFNPIPILLDPDKDYKISIDELTREILGRGLGGLLLSNPNNPVGFHKKDEELDAWVSLVTKYQCMTIIDEFYSHFVWNDEVGKRVSAAAHIKDVNQDPVIILDGMTKNWRYPGFRVAWIVAPKEYIEAFGSSGSFLDGGASHPLQWMAKDIVDEKTSFQEACAIQKSFHPKRDFLLKKLKDIGIKVPYAPDGAFYIWGKIDHLREPLNSGIGFFKEALKYEVITVPGEFFDVDPGGRRKFRKGRFDGFVRFSFGPEMDKLEKGVSRLSEMLSR